MDYSIEQREYYTETASHYDAMHVDATDEHGMAIAAFAGVASLYEPRSILDVGAGTGRALEILNRAMPEVRVVGVEPVEALRRVGHSRGIHPDSLIDGDAYALPFADGEFDFVIESGVLHHLANPGRAVAEMIRVARFGVMISDSNKYGQGRPFVRRLKAVIRTLGLWRGMIALQTRGKMAKWSEGDGLFYSYSPFDDLSVLRRGFDHVLIMNTGPLFGTDMRTGASHIMILALGKDCANVHGHI